MSNLNDDSHIEHDQGVRVSFRQTDGPKNKSQSFVSKSLDNAPSENQKDYRYVDFRYEVRKDKELQNMNDPDYVDEIFDNNNHENENKQNLFYETNSDIFKNSFKSSRKPNFLKSSNQIFKEAIESHGPENLLQKGLFHEDLSQAQQSRVQQANEALERENISLVQENRDLKEELLSNQIQITNLKNDLDEIRQHLMEANSSIQKREFGIQHAGDRLTSVHIYEGSTPEDKKKSKFEEQLEIKQKEIDQICSELRNLKSKEENANKKYEKMKIAFKQQVQEFKEQMNNYVGENESLLNIIDQKERIFISEKAQMKASIDDLNFKNLDLQERLKISNSSILLLQENIDSLLTTQKTKKYELDNLETDYGRLVSEVQSLKREKEKLIPQLKTLSENYDLSTRQLEGDLEYVLKKCYERISLFEVNTNSDKKRDLSIDFKIRTGESLIGKNFVLQMNGILDDFQDLLAYFKARSEETGTELEARDKLLQDYVEVINSQDDHAQNLKEEVNRLRNEIEGHSNANKIRNGQHAHLDPVLQDNNNIFKRENELQSSEILKFKEELSILEDRVKRVQMEKTITENQLHIEEQKSKSQSDNINHLEEQHRRIEGELNRIMTELQNKESECDELARDNENLRIFGKNTAQYLVKFVILLSKRFDSKSDSTDTEIDLDIESFFQENPDKFNEKIAELSQTVLQNSQKYIERYQFCLKQKDELQVEIDRLRLASSSQTTIKVLKDSVSHLNQSNQELSQQNQNLMYKLEQYEIELDNFTNELETKNSQISYLEKAKASITADREQLISDFEDLKEKYENAIYGNNTLLDRLCETTELKKEKMKDVNVLEEKIVSLQRLSTQMKQVQNENDVLVKQLDHIKRACQSKDAEIEHLTKEIKSLDANDQAIINANQKFRLMNDQKVNLEKEMENKSVQISDLMAKLKDLTARMTNLIAENNQLKEEGIYLKQRYSDKRSKSEKPNRDKLKISEEIENLKQENSELKARIDENLKNEKNLNDRIEDLSVGHKVQIENLLMKIRVAENDKLKLIEYNELMSNQLEKSKFDFSEHQRLLEKLNSLEVAYKLELAECDSLRQTNASLNEMIKSHEIFIQKLKEENEKHLESLLLSRTMS
jgi:chromosome segregation ATPase